MSRLPLIALLLSLTVPVQAQDTLVRTVAEFDAAVRAARPGAVITLANGVWTDAHLEFEADGAEGDSITVRAQTPGGVLLTGTSTLRIGGRYLKVDGLWFHRGALDGGHVIRFRSDDVDAQHSRLTNCAVTEYNPPNWLTEYKWISLHGTHNRVDHCYFAGKTHDGATLVVWLEDPPNDQPNYHRIDQNHFGHRPLLGKNGAEAIRIGTSHRSMQNSRTLVEHNLFEQCNGEHEIISNKTGENHFRHNTFLESQGTLTLRHGNRATIEANFFLGNGVAGTGGVRVIGEDHRVVNNYFAGLQGEGTRSTLPIMNGIPNSPLNRYFQVKNALIAHNTFVGNRNTIVLGLGADTEKSLPPQNVRFVNNVVTTDTDAPVITVVDAPDGLTWTANVVDAATLGTATPDGITRADARLVRDAAGLWQPGPDSPLLDAAVPLDGVTHDVQGQPRTTADIGANERSEAPVRYRPLTPTDVGPAWRHAPWTPAALTDPAVTLPDFSYAGYRWGEQDLPHADVTLDVTDFGADGQDTGDDTAAFRRALAAAHAVPGPVVLYVPPGRFNLSGLLFIERSDFVLRGAGSGDGGTIISVEKPLGALDLPAEWEAQQRRRTAGETVWGRPVSPFSTAGGVFWTRLPTAHTPRTRTTVSGVRGTHTLDVASSDELKVGQVVRVARQDVTIVAVDVQTVTVKEPLLRDLAEEVAPELSTTAFLENVGIEGVRVTFEANPYGGHGLEDGYNAFYLTDLRHGWLRDVHVHDADAGVLVERSAHLTLRDVAFTGRRAHVNVHLAAAQHVLVTDTRSDNAAVHPISFGDNSRGNVFAHSTMHRPSLSSHGDPGVGNLFDDLTLVEDRDHSTLFGTGARAGAATMTDAARTFWNTRFTITQPAAVRLPLYLGTVDGNTDRIVGLQANVPVRIAHGPAAHVEGVNRPHLSVPSLYDHQRRRRLAQKQPKTP